MTVTSIFDRNSLLDRVGNDEEIIARVMRMFIEGTPAELNSVKEFIERNNALEAGLAAHKIKGSANMLSCQTLSGVATAMEKAGRGGDLQFLRRSLPDLEKAFAQVRNIFIAELGDG